MLTISIDPPRTPVCWRTDFHACPQHEHVIVCVATTDADGPALFVCCAVRVDGEFVADGNNPLCEAGQMVVAWTHLPDPPMAVTVAFAGDD
jgi:hypothetical protein